MAYVDLNSKLDWASSFQRTGTFPLDRSSMFSSYADALAYAKQDGTDSRQIGGTSYIGQIIVVYGPGVSGEGEEIAAYLITAVGAGASLTKLASTTASGDLASDVADLQSRVGQLETKVTALEEKDSPTRTEFTTLSGKVDTNTSGISSVSDRVDTLETKIEGLTGAMHFAGASTTDPATGTVTIEGKPEYTPAAGDVVTFGKKEYVYNGTSWTEFGDEGSHITQDQADGRYVQQTVYNAKVSELEQADTTLGGRIDAIEGAGYITETAADGKYVAKESGKSLVQDTLITKLTNLPEFTSFDENEFEIGEEDKAVSIKALEQSKVTGLAGALAAKADSSAVTAVENRVGVIEGKEAGWDAKYAKPEGGIPATDLAAAVQASLGKADTALQEVADGSITNEKLDATLQGKVAQAHTHSNKTVLDSITAAFTTELAEKLSGIEAGANKYILPQATEAALGGIKAVAKGEEDTTYTNEVKIDTESGKLYAAAPTMPTIDDTVTEESENAVKSKGIYTFVTTKETALKEADTRIEGKADTNASSIEALQGEDTAIKGRLDNIETNYLKISDAISYEEI